MDRQTWNSRAEPYGPTWNQAANRMARDHAPEIYPCPQCKAPRKRGYRCGYCGSGD